MKYFKRKDGSVFGKKNPSKNQVETYKKEGSKVCSSEGELVNTLKKKDK